MLADDQGAGEAALFSVSFAVRTPFVPRPFTGYSETGVRFP